jgi:RimJ/RimL family protein N-acetyltransferase
MKPILETPRLLFRLMEKDDFDSLLELDSNPEIRAFFPSGTLNPQQVLDKILMNQSLFQNSGFCDFIVLDKVNQEFLGRAGFGLTGDREVEIGYVFLKKFHGLGYASESVAGLLKWGFENLAQKRFIAFAPLKHLASHKVMEKCGMRYFKTDEYQDVSCKFYEVKRV